MPVTSLISCARIWLLAGLAATIMAVAGTARAEEDCPDWNIDAIETKAKAAATCGDAYKVVTACIFGSGADSGPAGIVIDKCEGEFLDRLTKAQRSAYQKRLDACARKYERKQGSMYQSMAVHCQVDVALAYAKRHGKPVSASAVAPPPAGGGAGKPSPAR